jgi:predicted DNA-binding antitoxin AbrB/MazE fold protein
MVEASDTQIEVIYQDGVFKPLKDIKLDEGTRAFVTLRPGSVLEATRRHRIKVSDDVMREFIEERR